MNRIPVTLGDRRFLIVPDGSVKKIMAYEVRKSGWRRVRDRYLLEQLRLAAARKLQTIDYLGRAS